MKKKNLLFAGIALATLTSCSYVRIGDLTSISNRNLDKSESYVLLEREVEATAKAQNDAMEEAVDNLTKEYQGEFLRNVKMYVKSNGKKVKIIGDVWGIQKANVEVKTNVKLDVNLKVGDKVVFRKKKKIIKGEIIGINTDNVIVEYGKGKRIELKHDDVTKTANESK